LSLFADIWAFGIIVYELFSYPNIVTNSFFTTSEESLPIQTKHLMNEIRDDTDILNLLNLLLRNNPIQRLEMSSVLNHEFLNKVLHSSKLESNHNSIAGLRQYIEMKSKKTYKQTEQLEISSAPTKVVEQTLNIIAGMNKDQLQKLFIVSFNEEQGIDCGALTTSLYNRVLNNCDLLVTLSEDSGREKLVPLVDSDNDHTIPDKYRVLGKLLVKILFDQRTIPVTLAPYVWRFLVAEKIDNLSQLVSLKDIDMLDYQYSNNLRLITVANDVSDWYLDFSEVDNGNQTPVTNANRKQYLQKCIEHKLINSRLRNLTALREGFRCIPELIPFLNQMNEIDLAVLFHEKQYIDVQILISCLNYYGEVTNELKQNFESVLKSLSQEELKKVLYFVTGQVGLFKCGSNTPIMNPNRNEIAQFPRDKITILFSDQWDVQRYPVAHVCFYRLDMPLYSTQDIMKNKLLAAINLVDEAFDLY
jgi:hypothetical protein